jgi:hypothetical protein
MLDTFLDAVKASNPSQLPRLLVMTVMRILFSGKNVCEEGQEAVELNEVIIHAVLVQVVLP